MELGGALFEQGRYPEAAAAYREAIRLRPDFAQAHVSLGLALARTGAYGDAESALRRALSLNPKDATAVANLTTVLRRQRKVADAEVVQREALAREVEPATVRRDLGDTLYEQGRYPEAAAAYREALTLAPNDPKAQRGSAWPSSAAAGWLRPPERIVTPSGFARTTPPCASGWASCCAGATAMSRRPWPFATCSGSTPTTLGGTSIWP